MARIQIYPGDLTIDLDDQVQFSAIAYDRDNTPVGGIKVLWRALEILSGRRARMSPHGKFEATGAGSFGIVAEGAGKTATINVVVRPGVRRNLNAVPRSIRQVSTRDLPSSKVTKRAVSNENVARSSKKVADARSRRGGGERAHAAISNAAENIRASSSVATVPLLPDEGWGESNYWSADDPGNRVGDPPGGATDDGAGNGNFQIAAPVLDLAGRGIDLSLGLAYNSRLWNKADPQITYDIDRGWPAPGWSLGFGKILGMGVYRGGMIVEADGTRHGYNGTVTEYPWGTTFVGHTTDGTFIDYSYTSGAGGGIVWAQAKLPDGTVISYGAPGPGAVYPTSIKDPNGNYITITYVNNAGPRIQTITDTLGRAINFHYDASNFLTAITAPGLGGGTRTLVRLNYRQISLNYSFSQLTASVRESSPWVINAIFYPGTNTGYWFGDPDSYSTYGMLAKVSERRAMSFSAGSLNDQGTVTSAGQITREEIYSYPLTTGDPGGSNLTDAPTYSSMTERWSRDGTNIDQAVTNYSSQPNGYPRTVTITLPNGTKSIQYSHNYTNLPDYDPLKALDGVVYEDKVFDASDNLLQSSTATWERGAYDSPRPTRVEVTNVRQLMTATEFSYGGVYNQVIEMRNYDYGGINPLRVTRTQYQNSNQYTGQQNPWGHYGRHIFNLPLVVEVFAGDGVTRVSRTDYQYDGQVLTARPDVVQHDESYNPHAADEGLCYWDSDWSDPDCGGSCLPELMGCDGYCPQVYFCPYDPATDYRGNVTQVTTYGDAINLTGSVTETRRYDITGNLVTTSSSCCEQTSFSYTSATQYGYPLSQTRGSSTDALKQLTTSATYDFNTGLIIFSTDPNGRTAETTYFPASLRPQNSILPGGAHSDYTYDDTAMTVTEKTYLGTHPGDSGLANHSVKYLNGRGQVRREEAFAGGTVWDIVDVIYDNMGRVSQQTRPYRGSDQVQLTKTIYDALSRVVGVEAPDGTTTQSFYNEVARPSVASSAPGETTRVRDAWGRERWGRTDAEGRLVEVVEPNPSGSGSVFEAGALLTAYSYNTSGNLTLTNQGGQLRSFKYDSLGRLTAQKLAEKNATLNDAGIYQAGGGTWSDVFVYDERSNLISSTDARGVKTVYNFNGDPLNRLQSVSWDTSSFGDTANPILPAATVTYQYRTKTSGSQLIDITQMSSVTTAGVSTESYVYDVEGRVSTKTLTLTSRPAYPFVTDYIFDTLGRITDVRYPAEYGNGMQPRKVVHHEYDVSSRLSALTVDGATHASQMAYNAASQTTSMSVGASGPNQIIESYGYEAQTGLLANQTVARSATPTNYLLNLSYDYQLNAKRTGQLVKILNNLNQDKDRGYSYDALGRLVQAKGGPAAAPIWTQTYSYDNFGNRTNVSASGYSAKLDVPNSEPAINTRQLATTPGRANFSPAPSMPSLAAMDRTRESETTGLFAHSSSEPLRNFHHARSGKLPNANAVEPQSPPSKIAFASNRDGSSQVYFMNADGTSQTRLTSSAGNDDAPRWSPNNSKIVFQSDRDIPFCAIFDIYTMNADGSGQTRLTTDINDDSAPVWSPDGTKIAFQSMRNGAKYQIYVMNADGSGQTNISNSAANDTQPSWSPDGTKIAFSSDRDSSTGQSDIYVMNSNGSNQTRLSFTNDPFSDSQPAWSVDGLKLAFTSTRDSTIDTWTDTDDFEIPEDDGQVFPRSRLNINKEIYVMNANGSGQTRLTNTLENDETPAWSGDGSKIVFRSDRERDNYDPVAQIWVMNSDGTAQSNLSNDECGDFCPSWQKLSSNLPPAVSITGPANGASFIAPASISITANATDSDGTISRVEFYQGTTLLGTDTSAPYAFNWTTVAAGNYSLTAKATDNVGSTTASTAVSITVNPDQPPTVAITAPATGTTFTAPASISITANASDGDGTVSSVEFYQGTTLIGTDTTAPYAFNWNNVGAGNYSLTAKATDNVGGTTASEPVSITVNAAPIPIPLDGHASLSYDTASNRITTSGFAYDAAGNQVRALIPGGSGSQRFRYDAANRLVQVRSDDNNTIIASYTYGDSNERLILEEAGVRTYYACDGKAEYTESGGSTTPAWSKSYIYLGARLLSTLTPNGSGGEAAQYHHPDRLGTRLVTNAQDTSFFEQATLPFGSALNAESTGATNRRFTSYDRSTTTGIDYAMNRHYDSQQGRFTQVDPIEMASTAFENPQTLNLYAYCTNDPINHVDPSGLGFFSFLKRLFKKIVRALKAALAAFVVAFVGSGGDFRRARSAAVNAFVSDLGFRVRTWRPTGTAPTFPVGTGRPALHQIFQGTILSGVFPSPQSYLRWVNGFSGGTITEQLRGYPCPPSVAEIFTGRDQERVGKVLSAAFELAPKTGREEGGWIYMNRKGRLIARMKKEGGRNISGLGMAIDLWDPPTNRGYIVVATFHTHDFDMDPSMPTGETISLPNDIWTNEAQGVPGIIIGTGVNVGTIGFNGYGPKRGFWRQQLPKRCQK